MDFGCLPFGCQCSQVDRMTNMTRLQALHWMNTNLTNYGWATIFLPVQGDLNFVPYSVCKPAFNDLNTLLAIVLSVPHIWCSVCPAINLNLIDNGWDTTIFTCAVGLGIFVAYCEQRSIKGSPFLACSCHPLWVCDCVAAPGSSLCASSTCPTGADCRSYMVADGEQYLCACQEGSYYNGSACVGKGSMYSGGRMGSSTFVPVRKAATTMAQHVLVRSACTQGEDGEQYLCACQEGSYYNGSACVGKGNMYSGVGVGGGEQYLCDCQEGSYYNGSACVGKGNMYSGGRMGSSTFVPVRKAATTMAQHVLVRAACTQGEDGEQYLCACQEGSYYNGSACVGKGSMYSGGRMGSSTFVPVRKAATTMAQHVLVRAACTQGGGWGAVPLCLSWRQLLQWLSMCW